MCLVTSPSVKCGALLALLFTSMLTACHSEEEGVALEPDSVAADAESSPARIPKGKTVEHRRYFPLPNNMRWEYRGSYTVFGKQNPTSAVATVSGEAAFDGKAYTRLDIRIDGSPLEKHRTEFYRYGPDGVYEYADGAESLVWPLPLAVGNRWEVVKNGRVVKFEVAGKTAVQCGSHSFEDCYRITSVERGNLGEVTREQWLAIDVGLVKQTERSSLFSMTSSLANCGKQ